MAHRGPPTAASDAVYSSSTSSVAAVDVPSGGGASDGPDPALPRKTKHLPPAVTGYLRRARRLLRRSTIGLGRNAAGRNGAKTPPTILAKLVLGLTCFVFVAVNIAFLFKFFQPGHKAAPALPIAQTF
eukprot:GHVT01009298.1.p1 GENE.GHVT01009298.1~~GHVT01009298.1.p1  ORF type:complete len:128 (-),score=22.08 GHVT01009298.1:493-876(-)